MQIMVYTWSLDIIYNFARYILLAGAAWLIFYKWKNNHFAHLKIQTENYDAAAVKREIIYSLSTLVLFSLTGLLSIWLFNNGYTKVYSNIQEAGIIYFIVSVPLLVLLHDTYFYWTHRLLHASRLLRSFHRIHHLSVNPTPWAAYSFHPVEAIINAAFMPLIILILPLHVYAILIFLFIATAINVVGHLGYEFCSEACKKSVIGRLQNTSTNHNLHHEKGHGNYGLYFTLWDRLMKTDK